jgi:hypothetical protein
MNSTTEIISGLPLRNSLKTHYEVESLIELIVGKLKHIPKINDLRSSLELIHLVCELIENTVQSRNSKARKPVNKEELVIRILDQLFELTDLEKRVVSRHIQYLCDAKLIKRITRWSRFKQYVYGHFFCRSREGVYLEPLQEPPNSV